MDLNLAIVALYLVAMLGFGFWGRSRTKSSDDYLVAGRRLGTFLYTGTMAAVVLGGASTVGGVGLGYKMGLSGMWLVVAIGVGVLLLSLLFAGTISKLRVYTVSDMLELRYGSKSAAGASSIVMMLYTMFLVVTSTGAYATVLHVLTGLDSWICIAIGGAVVLVYSVIGGMWSITLADQVQFIIKTIGIFALMLPFTLSKAGGFDGIRERMGDQAFNLIGDKNVKGVGAEIALNPVSGLVQPIVPGATMRGPRPDGFGVLNDRVNNFCAVQDLVCDAPPNLGNAIQRAQDLVAANAVHAQYATNGTVVPGQTVPQWIVNWARDLIQQNGN